MARRTYGRERGGYPMGVIAVGLASDRVPAIERSGRDRLSLVMDALVPLAPDDRILNASFPGAIADTISRRLGHRVEASHATWTRFPDRHFAAAVEVEMRATDLFDHFARLARLLRPRGRLAFTAW